MNNYVKMLKPVREIAREYQGAGLEYFALVTDLIPGINEVQVPTIEVSADVDLGSLVSSAFSRVSGAVVSLSGVAILAVSAVLTAHALRQGTHRAFSHWPYLCCELLFALHLRRRTGKSAGLNGCHFDSHAAGMGECRGAGLLRRALLDGIPLSLSIRV